MADIDLDNLPAGTEVALDWGDHDAPGEMGTITSAEPYIGGEPFYGIEITKTVYMTPDQIRAVKVDGTWQIARRA